MNPNALKNRPVNPQAADMVEWEEMPSFVDTLSRRLIVRGARGGERADFQQSSVFPPWDNTMPAALDPAQEPAPLLETAIGGLVARELHEPEVFRYFFA
ncbi:hypothetical protein [Piscinibacter sakaiensis]|uniref:hypothetical protein n=1 Tax=Piscinibacter sakaiensis TaxID=1547922 RepID=UPI003AADC740